MRLHRKLIVAAVAVAAITRLAHAQAPKTGWRAEFLAVYGEDEGKYTQLASAISWDKYQWRPGKGVRSVCEVFLHISGANYMFAEFLGAKTPGNVDTKNIEKCPASKEAVLATMKASFAHIKAAVVATPDASADKAMTVFGSATTTRGLLTMIAEHGGEHLGQSIAYARTNGVVPPWSK